MKSHLCRAALLGMSILAGATMVNAQSTEYLRPGADANSTNSALRSAACGGSGTNIGSTSNSAVYSGKTTAGPTGSSAYQDVAGSTLHNNYAMRVFSSWGTTTNTYTSLTLNISTSCTITDTGDNVGGHCGAAYSTDGGATWTSLYSYTSSSSNGDSQTTYNATITGATLSNLQIGVCSLAKQTSANSSEARINLYDGWTAGIYGLASQSISFTAPTSPVNYGVSPISLVATGGASGNPVTFSVLSGPGSISGNTLTVTGVGTIVVAADQAGNTYYSAAPEVTQNVVVNQATQSITFTQPASPQTYGASPLALSASATSGLTVTFSVISGPGSISGNSLTMTGTGTIVVAANQAGNTYYSAASQITKNVVVNLPSQTISFTAPSSEPYGASPITLSATATSGLTVSFSVISGSCSLSGSTLTFTGSGTCIVAADQAGNSSWAAAPEVTQSIVVASSSTGSPQTQADPMFTVNATYVNGVAPGFWPTKGSGLSLTVSAGTVFCAGTIQNYATTSLAMTASTTNYVYLNTSSSCAPATKTTAFTTSDIPIAIVVTGGSTITSIQDDRTPFVWKP